MSVFALTGDLESSRPLLLILLGLVLLVLAPLDSLWLLLLLLLLLLLHLLLLLALVLPQPPVDLGLELMNFLKLFVPALPGAHPGIPKLDS